MLATLLKLGLSEKEGKVYLATLELGTDTVQNIAKKSKVNRATTYVILDKLTKLGLVSTHEEIKKSVFVAENPSELQNILEDEHRKIEQRKKYLEASLGELSAVYNTKKDKPSVRYFEGAEGLEALDRYGHEQLKKGSTIRGIVPIDLVEELFSERRKKSLGERIKLNVHSKTIYTSKNGPITTEKNVNELREARFISRDKLPINATIGIYENWGVKIFYFDKHKPYGILIQSPELAHNFKEMFELAWLGAEIISKKNK